MYKITQEELDVFLKALDTEIFVEVVTLDIKSEPKKRTKKINEINNLIKIQDKWKRQQS